MRRVIQTFGIAVVLASLLTGWAWAGRGRPVASLHIADEVSNAALAAAEDPHGEKRPHDLTAMRAMTKAILEVKENYVDPSRIKPKEMFIQALEWVEKTVPDVLVEPSADSNSVKLNVNGKIKDIDTGRITSPWTMSMVLKDTFEFISKNMRPMDDTRDIEFAAVNGMLSTLDPHSVLLRPEMNREMKLTTKGEFGGLGFVIQMREGNLTVVKVLPKTPAFRAGIKKDDQIKRIGEESTVNMDLNEAVGKLRGVVDTKVTITVERKSWDKPVAMTLTRALINVESVQSKLLAQNVAYVRVKNFQGNTTRSLEAALSDLASAANAQGGLKGLVLDLRGNPGGLLDQAIQMSDLFVSKGTIVATVGLSDKVREEKKARYDDTDDLYPIVVLVNAGSASASEIVAGALKNLNRALIVGRQTFGKGSVQVLYDAPYDTALKLTIAKYLTPGDVSIQEVGITPDIELVPTRVTKDRIEVFAPRKVMGEADLDHHFGNPSNDKAAKKRDDVVVREKPAESLKYLKDEPEKKEKVAAKDEKDKKSSPAKATAKGDKHPLTDIEAPTDEELDDQLDAETQDEIKEDFEVQFARDVLLAAPFKSRLKMLESARQFVADKRTAEENRIAAAVSALNIDWSKGDRPKKVELVGVLKPGPEKKLTAGDTVQLELSVENKGTEPLSRLRAWTESDNGLFDRREFVFGKLKPQETRSWPVAVKIPKDWLSRRDGITVHFQDDTGTLPDTVLGEVDVVELPRPSFAWGTQVVDDCATCNGDGLIQRGESFWLVVNVTNVGPGRALDTFASIKNVGDANAFIEKGRWKIGEIAPGETRQARFKLEVKKGFKGKSAALRMVIVDEPIEEVASDKLELPVADDAAPPIAFDPHKGAVRVAEKTDLYASAAPDGKPMARTVKPLVLNELAVGSTFARVELEPDRFAFVKTDRVKDAKGQKTTPPKDLEFSPVRVPPTIALNVDSAKGAAVSSAEKFTLSAVVANPELIDAYVMVNDQKVFFKARGPTEDPSLKFTTEFPLKEGNNYVTVVARESQDFAGRKTVVVRRRAAAVAEKVDPAAKPQPRQ